MKNKILFMLLSVLLPMMAMAQRISNDEAKEIASHVLGKKVVKAEVKKPTKAPSVNVTTTSEPFYSVFTGEDGNGFVIVSTDHRAPKIIGYGDGKADANNLPPQLKAILEKQDSVLQATPNLPEHSSWRKSAPTRADSECGKLLKTANWGQGYPYNLMTPEIDGQHCVTGCVATAMAIIMKYHGWPEKGRGEHSYDWNGESLSFDYANTTFDWSQMPEDFIEGNFTEAQAQEVSKLMRAAGNAINMGYGQFESGAYVPSVVYNLYRYFKYNLPQYMQKNKEVYYMKDDVSDADWLNLVYRDIDSGHPVIYNGSNENYDSHAFILDGYYSNNQIHVNWGWGGIANGWYDLLVADNPFYQYPGVLRLIEPDREATTDYAELFIDDGSSNGYGQMNEGLNISVENIESGVEFQMSLNSINYIADGSIGVGLFSKEGGLKEVFANIPCKATNDYFIKMLNIPMEFAEYNSYATINSEIDDYDYLQVLYKKEGVSEWKKVLDCQTVATRLPAKGNKPIFRNLTWNIKDESVRILNSNKKELTTLPDKLLAGTNPQFFLESDKGIPYAYVNGRKGTYYSTDGIMLPLNGFKSSNIEIDIIPYYEMESRIVHLEAAELLNEKVTEYEAERTNELTITGCLKEQDFEFLNANFIGLEKLDLSEASIIPDNILSRPNLLTIGCTSLSLPKTLKGIDFMGLRTQNLQILFVPKSVEYIGNDAFYCLSTKSVVLTNPEPIPYGSGNYLANECVLYVPKGSKEAYMNADVWKDFPKIIEYEGEWHETIDAEKITLDKSELSMTVGSTEQLTATVLPEDATDKTVTWTSSDESVATVSADGLVTAINIGTAVITATCGEASATCTVTVTPDAYTITYLVDGEMYHTETVKIGATITPIAEPEKEGYTFSGWSKIPETMPAHDVTVTGTFTVNKYMVRYYDGETLLAEFEVEFGAEIPQYEYNNEEFIFEGWEGETYETMPAHDIAFYAITTPNGIADILIDDDEEITIYDLTGLAVYKGKKAGTPKHLQGLYIINYGNKSIKCRL